MPKRIFITTPIYYVNSVPHIGTALTTFASDVSARYAKMRGCEVTFLTGTDENGLKVMEAAQKVGKSPQSFVDEISQEFRRIWTGMKIEYDDFIRTTEPRHVAAVHEVFKRLRDKGYIYPGTYEGWYDVSSETFYKEADLVDGKSPDGNEVRWVQEENYFFKLSAFEERLRAHIEAHPSFIQPEVRRNEVLGFMREGLRDTCITRSNQGWGITVPGDDSKVIYVWFDALINYISATGWPGDGWQTMWPAEVQWMGKDILTRFHATLWPAMLMGLELPLPEVLMGHGWMTVGGEKISKSKGNVVAPLELAQELAGRAGCTEDVAIDAVRHYMATTMPYENDSMFTYEDFDRRYNVDLANDLGNALNRSLAMAHKFVGGAVPDAPLEAEASEAIAAAKSGFESAMAAYRIDRASEAAFSIVRFLNKYIDTRAPWALAKADDPALAGVVRSMLACLRAAEGLIRPMLPSTADAIAAQLGVAPLLAWDVIGVDEALPPGTALGQPEPIFPRLEADKPAAQPKQETPKVEKTEAPVEQITIEEFAKVQFRIARVLEAEPLEGADKLLKLQVMIGDERRQIVAGIRKNYDPLDLIGRQVVVVANLKPAMLRGTESQGMLLAAVDENGGAILLQPDKETPEGAKVR
ncbi:MAG: methionine--tRNA ligase [Fimbriimonadaceae bacterium]|nr:methionine--tRNA ligase [Fimbriimonadaceae bacterium]